MQYEYFVVRNAENIHFPYVIITFLQPEAKKPLKTYVIWSGERKKEQFPFVFVGFADFDDFRSLSNAKNSINPCTK